MTVFGGYRWLPTPVALIGSLLALLNVVVIAFGIQHLTRQPDLEVAAWVVVLTWLLSRKIDEQRTGILPVARTL